MSFIVSLNFSMIDLFLAMTAPSNPVVRTNRPGVGRFPNGSLLRQLKPLEAIEFFLDAALVILAGTARGPLADPVPFLHQQFPVLAVGLEIEGGDNVLPHQHRQREVAEQALLLGHIGLETMAVVEEQFGSLALDDQGIERRENVDEAGVGLTS